MRKKGKRVVIFAVWGKRVYENWILRRRQRLRACGPPNSLLLAMDCMHALFKGSTRPEPECCENSLWKCKIVKIGWLRRTRRKPRQSVPLQNLSEPRR